MNKGEFIAFISEEMAVSKAEAGRFLDTFISGVQKHIVKEDIKLSGLGAFSIKKRKSRVGRNPATGEEIKISARWVPSFKASTTLKEIARKKK